MVAMVAVPVRPGRPIVARSPGARRHSPSVARTLLTRGGTEVVLVGHPAYGITLQPGHLEPTDTTLIGAAVRELVEEPGIDADAVVPVPWVSAIPGCRRSGCTICATERRVSRIAPVSISRPCRRSWGTAASC